MDIVYAVPWIEIDFGQRPEGYKIFLDKEDCIRQTVIDSYRGPGSSGYYCGPERPIKYVETIWDILQPEVQKSLRNQVNKGEPTKGHPYFCFSTSSWQPKLKSDAIYITDEQIAQYTP